ncbi:MAG: GNAT family N-acetyltransferase [Alphaproteobacteria bacterium]|nr:GNAT family N-acetyltransferase [Alphaproteobacteria bacterium]
MIRACRLPAEFETVLAIINDAAIAYRGVIPADRWHEPYMPADELRHEIAAGVAFAGYEEAGGLVGVMGAQPVDDVMLIRHAYVRTARRNRGIGGALLGHLLAGAERPVLIGTWAAARWAIVFYEKHGFTAVGDRTKDRLLRRYWNVPERQIATSVVLADRTWVERTGYVVPKDADA